MAAIPKKRLTKLVEDLELQLKGERRHFPSEGKCEIPDSKYFGEREPDQRFKPDRKTFEVQQLWEVHHEIIRRLLLGQKGSHIARDLGVTPAMISYVRNSSVVKEKLEIMKGARDADTLDLAKRIRENAPTALKLLEDVIEGEVDTPSGEKMEVPLGMRVKEAGTMLSRAGYGPITNLKGQFAHGHFTKEDIDEIKGRARKDGIKSGSVIDATFSEVKGDEESSSNGDTSSDAAGT
jgi:hypothetical protein